MDEAGIVSAYEPFVEELREGGFVAPAEGWPAELVAAHVACNNDLIAEMAERIAIGEAPSYDNEPVVTDEELRAYADGLGGLDSLAGAVSASARRLGAAWASLDANTGAHRLPVRILHAGMVVRDDPISITEFIEGNASFHLDMHLAQLRALRP